MITDPRSSLTEKLRKRNRVERSPVSRSRLAAASDSSEISALVPQEHQIRMRSDERDNVTLWAQLFKGQLALNTGLNLTQISFSRVQKHFLG